MCLLAIVKGRPRSPATRWLLVAGAGLGVIGTLEFGVVLAFVIGELMRDLRSHRD